MATRDELNEILGGKPKKPEAEPDVDDLGPCAAQRRASLFGIGIKRPALMDKIIEYFDVEAEGDNTRAKLIMGARKVWMIEIEGRNLIRLLYLLKERKIEWIRVADRDFIPDDGKPYINKLEVTDVTERLRSPE